MEQQSLHSKSSGIIHPSEIVEQDWIVSSRSDRIDTADTWQRSANRIYCFSFLSRDAVWGNRRTIK